MLRKTKSLSALNRVLAIFVSVVLIASMANMTAFAKTASDDKSVKTEQTQTTDKEAAKSDKDAEADDSASGDADKAAKAQEQAEGYKLTITPSLSNVEAAYVGYSDAEAGTVRSLTPFTGPVTLDFHTTEGTVYSIVFVKPYDNYLLTGIGASGNGDIYLTGGDKSTYGNIKNYPNIVELGKLAKDDGYVACFGWSRKASTGNSSVGFEVIGQQPQISVSASSNKPEGVKPGDEISFTVRVTPGELLGKHVSVDGVRGKEAFVNGTSVTVTNLVGQNDGSYIGTISYTATEADCESEFVKMSVTAEVDYSFSVGISDGRNIMTTSSVISSATTDCKIAPHNKVTYELDYAGADGISWDNYPEAVKHAPVDDNEYFVGEVVFVDNALSSLGTVEDEANDGHWEFDGWYLDEVKVTDNMPMVQEGLLLKGTWTFAKNETEEPPAIEPDDPADPVDPTEPEDPTGPEEPVDPTEPEDPTGSEEPVDPAEPEDPADPADPSDPENPTEPDVPGNPEQPDGSDPDPSDPEDIFTPEGTVPPEPAFPEYPGDENPGSTIPDQPWTPDGQPSEEEPAADPGMVPEEPSAPSVPVRPVTPVGPSESDSAEAVSGAAGNGQTSVGPVNLPALIASVVEAVNPIMSTIASPEAIEDGEAAAVEEEDAFQAAAAPNARAIDDAATPLAEHPEQQHQHCWPHWLMIAGIILTLIYGIAVIANRSRTAKETDDTD